MNKLLAESSSQDITIINGKVVDHNNRTMKIKGNNKKFDVDVMQNGEGLLIRELKKKELVKLLKNQGKNKGLSLFDKLNNFSLNNNKKAKKRKSLKTRRKTKSKRERREKSRKKRV